MLCHPLSVTKCSVSTMAIASTHFTFSPLTRLFRSSIIRPFESRAQLPLFFIAGTERHLSLTWESRLPPMSKCGIRVSSVARRFAGVIHIIYSFLVEYSGWLPQGLIVFCRKLICASLSICWGMILRPYSIFHFEPPYIYSTRSFAWLATPRRYQLEIAWLYSYNTEPYRSCPIALID